MKPPGPPHRTDDMTLAPDLSRASDQDVVAWARQGREEAYRELVRRYRRPVLAFIFRIVHHRERAKDLAQNGALRNRRSL